MKYGRGNTIAKSEEGTRSRAGGKNKNDKIWGSTKLFSKKTEDVREN